MIMGKWSVVFGLIGVFTYWRRYDFLDISNRIGIRMRTVAFKKIMEWTPDQIIDEKGLRQVTDTGAIDTAIAAVLAANPKELEGFRSGKDKLFGFFVGQVMKETKGKANPAVVNDLLKKALAG